MWGKGREVEEEKKELKKAKKNNIGNTEPDIAVPLLPREVWDKKENVEEVTDEYAKIIKTDPTGNPDREGSAENRIGKERVVADEDNFAEKFRDWSDEQKKQAHDENFQFYVEKYLDDLNI